MSFFTQQQKEMVQSMNYAPAPRVGGIKRWCASDICLSVAYIGPKSRTERPRKTTISIDVAHVNQTPLSRSKGQLAGGVAYCGGFPHSLFILTVSVGESSLGQDVHGAKGPWGETYMGQNVLTWGEVSMGRNVRGAKSLDTYVLDKW